MNLQIKLKNHQKKQQTTKHIKNNQDKDNNNIQKQL